MKQSIKYLFLTGLCHFGICASNTMAQHIDYSWWNNIHQWDGISPWQSYLIYSPEYFGPNALPCPEVKQGVVEKNITATFDLETHLMNGEQTFNLLTGLFIPIAPGKVGLELNIVPVEYYNMDTIIRDKRASRDQDGQGFSMGDLYIATWISLMKESKARPNLLLSINLRTASGSNLDGVRFTDAPGYFFDLSTGKTLSKKGIMDSVYFYAMMGFYAWQVNDDRYRQDDAFMYGAGISAAKNAFSVAAELSGYYGYIGNGDRPIVLRLNLGYDISSTIGFELRGEQGLHDFPFSSLRAGIRWNLNSIFLKD